jgi:hypothetical protein
MSLRSCAGCGSRALPLLDVYVDPDGLVPQTCLIDTGAAGIRLSADLVRAAGTAIDEGRPAPDVVAGGVRSQVRVVALELAVVVDGRTLRWTAEASCCSPWPHPFGLLGHEGFLDRFDVRFDGSQGRFALSHARGRA